MHPHGTSDVEPRVQGAPRIPPGTRAELGRVNFGLARLLGALAGSGPPNLFTTLGRHRALFRKWLRFAGALMPGGALPRDESELLILRTAHNCACGYEWAHHERIALTAGLTRADVDRVRQDPQAAGWPGRRELLLRAADELHAHRTLSAELWGVLRPEFSDVELIELCMLVGHYEMLAMTLNALAVEPDALESGPPGRPALLVQRVLRRRRRAQQGAA